MPLLEAWSASALAFFPYPYLVPFFGVMVGGEGVVLVVSALAATTGVLSPGELVFWTFAGTVIADSGWFALGRYGGDYLEKWPPLHRKLTEVAGFVAHLTRRRHFVALLITKFLFGTRIIMLLYLAKERLTFRAFLFINAVVTLIWSVVVVGLGWFAGRGVVWASDLFGNITFALGLLLIAVVVVYGIRVWLNEIIVEGERR